MTLSVFSPIIAIGAVFLLLFAGHFLVRFLAGRGQGTPGGDRFFSPFFLSASESRWRVNVEVGRILLGVMIIHRFLDVFGVAAVGNAESIRTACLTAVFLGICILIGFMTPIALVLKGVLFLIQPPFFGTLGDQAALLVLWILLFLGAGRKWGVDSVLLKRPGASALMERIYWMNLQPTPGNFARVRFFGLLTFWSINFSAIAYHFFDPFWLRGEVLQLSMTSAFWNDHYLLFERLRTASPTLFVWLCKSGLYIQAFFETFLLPLMFLGWVGRFFVFAQGLGFFLISLLFINLGYLPIHELILWLLLFGYRDAVLPWSRKPEVHDQTGASKSLEGFILAVIMVCLTFNVLNLAAIHRAGWNGKWPWTQPIWKIVHRSLGQDPVNVFNKTDLETGAFKMVIWVVDEEGHPVRVVPFMGPNGGRLDYLRNDYIYFGRTLRWLRTPESAKFVDGNYEAFGPMTSQVVSTILELDSLVTGLDRPRRYRVEIGRRDIIETERFLAWGPWTSLVVREFQLSPAVINRLRPDEHLTFILPPGHWRSHAREERTLGILKSLNPSPSPPSG